MKTELYDYQRKIRDDIINSGDFGVGLFMKMGTGKTVTSLSVFEKWWEQSKVNKLLVVCLKCKIEDWKNELPKTIVDLIEKNVAKTEIFEAYNRLISYKDLVHIDFRDEDLDLAKRLLKDFL